MTIPSDIQANEDNPGSHDDEQRLEGGVVLEGLQGEALHRGEYVVVSLNQNLYSNFKLSYYLTFLPPCPER